MSPQYGGPVAAMHVMAQGLSAQGATVDVATIREQIDHTAVANESWEDRVSFRLIQFPLSLKPYRISLGLQRWLERNVLNYDLVHVHAVFTHASMAAARAARKANIPYIIRPLGILNQWGLQARRPWLKKIFLRWIDGPLLRSANVIHLTSKQELEEVRHLGLGTPLVELPLGIDLSGFSDLPDPSKFFGKHPEARGDPVVMFLSRLHPKKGLDLLLPAFEQVRRHHPEAKLVIVGDGSPDFVTQLHQQAKDLGIQNSIAWAGFLGENERLEALAACDIFCLPSHSENFGVALLEAMAAARACISSDQVALGATAAKTGAIVKCTCDVSSVASAILDLAKAGPARRKDLGDRALKYARDHHGVDDVGNRLHELYRRILQGSRSTGSNHDSKEETQTS